MNKQIIIDKYTSALDMECQKMNDMILNLISNSISFLNAKKVKSGERKKSIEINYVFNIPTDSVKSYKVTTTIYSPSLEDTSYNGILEDDVWSYYILPPYTIYNEEYRDKFNLKLWENVKNVWGTANLIANKLYEANTLPEEVDEEYIKKNCHYVMVEDF